MVGVYVYVLSYALDATNYFNDANGNLMGGRLIAHDLDVLVSEGGGVFQRGAERLTPLLLALPVEVFSSGADEVRGGQALLVAAYVLVAVPAYALMRGLGVPGWPAVALAAAAITGPWIVFGTTMLNVTLAAPLTAAFVWAAWRTAVEPSRGREVLVIVLAALMTTARAGARPASSWRPCSPQSWAPGTRGRPASR